jgi:hydroxymethylpyrimidine/phosphomethylpyrimidine kinase
MVMKWSKKKNKKGVELARQTEQLARGGDATMAATLAAAYAEAGQFDQAVAAARRALQSATRQDNSTLAAAIQAQLHCYEARSPFRDTTVPR